MSRIGRKPIAVPAGVKIQIAPSSVEVQGPKGKMSVESAPGNPLRAEGRRAARRAPERRPGGAAWSGAGAGGQRRARRHAGFKKDLDIVGVGYRAELKGKMVNFALGYSHPVEFPIPEGIQITVEKQTHLTVSGADRGQVGQVSADIRALASARSLQAKRHPHHRRAPEEEGRKGRRGQDGRLEAKERHRGNRTSSEIIA